MCQAGPEGVSFIYLLKRGKKNFCHESQYAELPGGAEEAGVGGREVELQIPLIDGRPALLRWGSSPASALLTSASPAWGEGSWGAARRGETRVGEATRGKMSSDARSLTHPPATPKKFFRCGFREGLDVAGCPRRPLPRRGFSLASREADPPPGRRQCLRKVSSLVSDTRSSGLTLTSGRAVVRCRDRGEPAACSEAPKVAEPFVWL